MSTFRQQHFFSSFLLLLARLRMLVPWRTPWHLLNRPVFWLMICSSGKKELFEANLVWLCLTYILLTNQHFWPISADVLSIEVQREQLGRSKWCNSKLGQMNEGHYLFCHWVLFAVWWQLFVLITNTETFWRGLVVLFHKVRSKYRMHFSTSNNG